MTCSVAAEIYAQIFVKAKSMNNNQNFRNRSGARLSTAAIC